MKNTCVAVQLLLGADALDAVPGAKAREAASIIIKNSAMLVRLPLELLLQRDLYNIQIVKWQITVIFCWSSVNEPSIHRPWKSSDAARSQMPTIGKDGQATKRRLVWMLP